MATGEDISYLTKKPSVHKVRVTVGDTSQGSGTMHVGAHSVNAASSHYSSDDHLNKSITNKSLHSVDFRGFQQPLPPLPEVHGNIPGDKVNISFDKANTSYDKTNISFDRANASYDKANTSYDKANTSYDKSVPANMSFDRSYDKYPSYDRSFRVKSISELLDSAPGPPPHGIPSNHRESYISNYSDYLARIDNVDDLGRSHSTNVDNVKLVRNKLKNEGKEGLSVASSSFNTKLPTVENKEFAKLPDYTYNTNIEAVVPPRSPHRPKSVVLGDILDFHIDTEYKPNVPVLTASRSNAPDITSSRSNAPGITSSRSNAPDITNRSDVANTPLVKSIAPDSPLVKSSAPDTPLVKSSAPIDKSPVRSNRLSLSEDLDELMKMSSDLRSGSKLPLSDFSPLKSRLKKPLDPIESVKSLDSEELDTLPLEPKASKLRSRSSEVPSKIISTNAELKSPDSRYSGADVISPESRYSEAVMRSPESRYSSEPQHDSILSGTDLRSPQFDSSQSGAEVKSPEFDSSLSGVEVRSPQFDSSLSGVEVRSPQFDSKLSGAQLMSPGHTSFSNTPHMSGPLGITSTPNPIKELGHDDEYYDIPEAAPKLKKAGTKKRKHKKRVLTGTNELKPFTYSTLINLLESMNGTIIGEEFNKLNLPMQEKQLIEKIVDSLSRLTLDMVIDKNRYDVGILRLERALRALEGF